MRVTRVLFALAALALLLLPARSEAQFRRNTVPTIPPPTITEYNPRSTLVVPEHEVPRAKFPAVDLHGHPPTLDNPEAINRVVSAMDELNLQVMVQARGSSGERLTRQIEAVPAPSGAGPRASTVQIAAPEPPAHDCLLPRRSLPR